MVFQNSTTCIGDLYLAEKQAHGAEPGRRGNQHTVVRGNESHKPCPLPKTADKVAAESGVAARTVKNDAAFAKAVTALMDEGAPRQRLMKRLGKNQGYLSQQRSTAKFPLKWNVSQTMKGGEVYKKLTSQLVGFEADYRQDGEVHKRLLIYRRYPIPSKDGRDRLSVHTAPAVHRP
jgi:hypothetical protein